MTAQTIPFMTVEQFLDWTPRDSQGGKWELVSGSPMFCQAEGKTHALVKFNVGRAFDRALPANGPCVAYVDGPALRIDAHTAYIPDVAIDCSDPSLDNWLEYPKPTVVVEVAVSTLARDMGEKALLYFLNPDVQVYIVADVAAREALIWRRGARELTRQSDGLLTLPLADGSVSVDVATFWARLPPKRS